MIKIDDYYTITSDAYNWVLTYKGDPKIKNHKGKVQEVIPSDVWYHSNLRQALKSYLNQKLKGSDSVEEVLRRMDEIEAKIDKIC